MVSEMSPWNQPLETEQSNFHWLQIYITGHHEVYTAVICQMIILKRASWATNFSHETIVLNVK